MGITLSQKKRKFIIAATLVVVTLLTLLSTTQTQKPNSSAVLNEETLSALDLDINRVSGKDTTGSAIQVQIPGEKPKHSKQEENDSNVETKKLTNGNQLVKGKEGEIDESKVRESETKNGSKKIPLVAGDPTAKKAHDKSTSDDDLVSSIKDKDSPLSGGIKADKVLGSAGQKEIHDSKIGNKKVGGGANNNLAMKAQEDAELNGVSHNVGSSFNPHSEFSNILSKSPVVIFSKSYCPYSKKLKQLLKEEYHISPEPVIVELDKHENGKELQEHVGKQTGRFTVPNFIIDGESHGGADDILALHENDELIDLFHSWAGGAAKIKKIGSTTEKNEI